jgi:hypothetical protein
VFSVKTGLITDTAFNAPGWAYSQALGGRRIVWPGRDRAVLLSAALHLYSPLDNHDHTALQAALRLSQLHFVQAVIFGDIGNFRSDPESFLSACNSASRAVPGPRAVAPSKPHDQRDTISGRKTKTRSGPEVM